MNSVAGISVSGLTDTGDQGGSVTANAVDVGGCEESSLCVEPIVDVTEYVLDCPCVDNQAGGVGPNGDVVDLEGIVFRPPLSGEGKFVRVYQKCVDGICDCCHFVGENRVDLKPCRAAFFMFGGGCSLPSEMVKEIWDGLCDGFRIVDNVEIPSYSCSNYDSITSGKFREEMSLIVQRDLDEGRIKEVQTKPHCVHALGGVEKSNGRLRPITDCSRPDAISVNNYMSSTFKNFSYNTVDDVAQCLTGGEFISVTDISNAYRSVNIFEAHSKYQGFAWEEGGEVKWYQENRLCFGLRSAPYIFNLLSDLVVDFARDRGVRHIVNYLDDFAVVGSTESECRDGQITLINVLRHLGFAVSWDKLIGPAQEVSFLGIVINTVKMNLSLPETKIQNLLSIISELEGKGFASKKQLERLGGIVAHCATVIKGGRTFSRRIYDLCRSCPRGGRVRLDGMILADLSWWRNLCHAFNGSAYIIPKTPSTSIITDSSFFGFGAWCDSDWVWGTWPWEESSVSELDIHDHRESPPSFDNMDRNINLLELWPVLAGLKRWAPLHVNTALQVITDNTQVLFMINSGRSRNRVCMGLLRELFWTCFVHNVDFFATYIASADNVLADALSRCNEEGKKLTALNVLSVNNMCCFNS